MANDLMRLAWRTRMPIGRKMVLLALADMADDDGMCWPSREVLADMAECGQRSVSRHLSELIEQGWVIQSRRRQRSAVYRVSRERLDAGAEAPQRRIASESVNGSPAVSEVPIWQNSPQDVPNRHIATVPVHGLPAVLDVPNRHVPNRHYSNQDVPLWHNSGSPGVLDVPMWPITNQDVPTATSRCATGGTSLKRTPKEPPRERNTLAPAQGRARGPDQASKAKSKRGRYTEAFEAFWAAYGRKGSKQDAAREWHQAIERADPDTIMAAVGPYVDSRELRWRKDAERWLKGDCWESAVVPAVNGTNGYMPYRNPHDQDDYDQPLLPRRNASDE